MSLFAEGVDHYHDRVISVRLREFDYEIDTYGVPVGVRRRKRFEMAGWWSSQNLGTEAEITRRSVLTDVPRHMRPPVVLCNQLESFPPTRVPSDVTVMVKCHYLLLNVSSGGNIDFAMEV
jgi:hypothetical protein